MDEAEQDSPRYESSELAALKARGWKRINIPSCWPADTPPLPGYILTSTDKPGMKSYDGVNWTKIETVTTPRRPKRRHYRQVVY